LQSPATTSCTRHCRRAFPELSAKFDVDQAHAAATRRNFLERYCDTETLWCTAHFPSPMTGKIRRLGNGFSREV
jgi:hypothetical protein